MIWGTCKEILIPNLTISDGEAQIVKGVLFKTVHPFGQVREIVRCEGHHIEWCSPQMNRVDGVRTLGFR